MLLPITILAVIIAINRGFLFVLRMRLKLSKVVDGMSLIFVVIFVMPMLFVTMRLLMIIIGLNLVMTLFYLATVFFMTISLAPTAAILLWILAWLLA